MKNGKHLTQDDKITLGMFAATGLLAAIITSNLVLNTNRVREVDERTKFLCHEYARRDHSGEFTRERYEANKDLIDNYDWYTSCINHVLHPVAGGTP